MSYFGKSIEEKKVGTETKPGLNWSDLAKTDGLSEISATEVYFTPMDKKTMENFREKFSGNQKERKDAKKTEQKPKKAEKKRKFCLLTVRQRIFQIQSGFALQKS